jgi:hypothetical protein
MSDSVRDSMWYGVTRQAKEFAKDQLGLSLYYGITRQLFSLTYVTVGLTQAQTHREVTNYLTCQTGPIFSGTQGGDE